MKEIPKTRRVYDLVTVKKLKNDQKMMKIIFQYINISAAFYKLSRI